MFLPEKGGNWVACVFTYNANTFLAGIQIVKGFIMLLLVYLVSPQSHLETPALLLLV